MITISDVEEANALLEKYKGGKAELLGLSATHQRLAIRLSNLDHTTYVAIIVLAQCRHINGPVRWTNANLVIRDQVVAEGGKTWVQDMGAKFEATADGGFGVLYGEWNEVGMSFDGSFAIVE